MNGVIWMELRNVMTFLKAAQLKNFAKTADELGYVPSTVTMQIQQLEAELGFLLFERIGKRIELTQLGQEFIEYATSISNLSDQIKLLGVKPAQVQGEIRVGVLESLCSSVLLSKLGTYSERFPNISLIIKTGSTSDLFNLLKHGELDLIFILAKKIVDKDCISVYEKRENLVFTASSSHWLTRRANVKLKEILDEPLILTEKVGLYRQALNELAANENLLVEPRMEINNTSFIVTLLTQELGVSFLPEYVVRNSVERGVLSVIQTDVELPYFWSQIFLLRNKWISPQIQEFISMIE